MEWQRIARGRATIRYTLMVMEHFLADWQKESRYIVFTDIKLLEFIRQMRKLLKQNTIRWQEDLIIKMERLLQVENLQVTIFGLTEIKME